MYNGRCLCGGVVFEITSELPPIQICYCKQCQRAQGTVFATNVPVDQTAFRLINGAELLKAFESSPGKQRLFCKECGSPIYSRRDSLPNVVRVRVGLIDGPLATAPSAHYHVNSKPNWWQIFDSLPQHPTDGMGK